MPQAEVVDITGRTLDVGQRIAYPVRRGSAMWLSTARIEQIVRTLEGVEIHARNPQGRPVIVKGIDRTVILPDNTPR